MEIDTIKSAPKGQLYIMNTTLDPRTKLLMLILPAVAIAVDVNLTTEIGLFVLLALPLFIEGQYKKLARYVIIYTILLVGFLYILPIDMPVFLYILLSFITNGMRKFLPSFMALSYIIGSSQYLNWLALMKRMHLPRFLTIPLSVMIRFFPVIKQDYHAIRQALAFRGIIRSNWDLVKHPIQSFEHILVPLLINASNAADDLTIAAYSKGLSLNGPTTSIVQLKLKTKDYIYTIALILYGVVVLHGSNLA